MKELKCKNCGAPLRSDGVCEYCGSVYQISSDSPILPVLLYEPKPITLEELRNEITNNITQCMLIQQNQDIINMTMPYRC